MEDCFGNWPNLGHLQSVRVGHSFDCDGEDSSVARFIHRLIPYEVTRQKLALLTILSFLAIL